MPEKTIINKCELCGSTEKMLDDDGVGMVCCGMNMQLFERSIPDEGLEKHIPVIERTDEGIRVKVGSIPHPMEEKHYIKWIEIIDGDTSYRQYLEPGQSPEAVFKCGGPDITAREYCSIHGIWKS